jgi:hypothetical protein
VKNKKSKYNLKRLLNEADPVKRPVSMTDFVPQEKKDFSLDQAIDKYFIQYERESIPTSGMYEINNLENLTKFLFEQELDFDLSLEDTPAPDAPAEDPGMDLGGAESATTPPEQGAAPPVIMTPKINLQDFARNVARLVNNVNSLIDIKSIILNRAEKYIRNNYDDMTAKEMVDMLDRNYNLKAVNQANASAEQGKYPQPRTGVTGPSGG